MKGKASFALGPDWYLSGELQSFQKPARIFGHFQLCWFFKSQIHQISEPHSSLLYTGAEGGQLQ